MQARSCGPSALFIPARRRWCIPLFLRPSPIRNGGYDHAIHDGWVTYPMMKIMNDFEESLKKFPPIKMGTPDPYYPPN